MPWEERLWLAGWLTTLLTLFTPHRTAPHPSRTGTAIVNEQDLHKALPDTQPDLVLVPSRGSSQAKGYRESTQSMRQRSAP